MTVEELDEIIKNHDETPKDILYKNLIDKTLDDILEKEHYKIFRRLDYGITTALFGILCSLLSIIFSPPIDKFLKILIPITIVLILITLFIFIWNLFRLPLRVKLLRSIFEQSVIEIDLFHDSIYKILEKPYINLYLEQKCKEISKHDELVLLLKKKIAEIDTIIRPIANKYFNYLLFYQNETILKKPLANDRYPRIQHFFDKLGDGYRYHIIYVTSFAILILFLYAFLYNYI